MVVMAKIALIYDKFLVKAGGERIFGLLLEAFPQADIFALNAHPRRYWEKKFNRRINTPILGFLFRSRMAVILFYPLACLLMSRVTVRADIAIAYSSSCGKYVNIESDKRILYSNYPNRGIYEPAKVLKNRLLRIIATPFLELFKFFELTQIRKFNKVISISETSRKALLKYTGVQSTVLLCPYDKKAIHSSAGQIGDDGSAEPYFLLISRLEPEKEINHIVKAFKTCSHLLRVIGTGSEYQSLRKMSSQNIKFLGFVEDDQLVREVSNCIAVIFPSDIEYSLVPIEANSLGKPVVAYDSESARELLIDAEENEDRGTAIFYKKRTSEEVNIALEKASTYNWKTQALLENAKRFDPDLFRSRLHSIVESQ